MCTIVRKKIEIDLWFSHILVFAIIFVGGEAIASAELYGNFETAS